MIQIGPPSDLRYKITPHSHILAKDPRVGVLRPRRLEREKINKLEYGPMPNVMAVLPNIGGALCSMPQSLADAHYYSAVQ